GCVCAGNGQPPPPSIQHPAGRRRIVDNLECISSHSRQAGHVVGDTGGDGYPRVCKWIGQPHAQPHQQAMNPSTSGIGKRLRCVLTYHHPSPIPRESGNQGSDSGKRPHRCQQCVWLLLPQIAEQPGNHVTHALSLQIDHPGDRWQFVKQRPLFPTKHEICTHSALGKLSTQLQMQLLGTPNPKIRKHDRYPTIMPPHHRPFSFTSRSTHSLASRIDFATTSATAAFGRPSFRSIRTTSSGLDSDNDTSRSGKPISSKNAP